jgi:hypothetical protein
MRNFVLALLVGTIALVPAFAAAQTGSGSGGKTPSGTSGSSGSGSGSSSMPSSGSSGSSGSGSSAPSASPSGTDLSTYKTQADCEKHGGMWTASTKSCDKK